MTKAETMHAFWSGFGMSAYEESAVPGGEYEPQFPYITYQLPSDSFGGEVQIAASLWDSSSSWAFANEKTEEISKKIGRGGIMLLCDGGAIWFKRGTPFAQSMGDDSDTSIKRKYLNITAEFLTVD